MWIVALPVYNRFIFFNDSIFLLASKFIFFLPLTATVARFRTLRQFIRQTEKHSHWTQHSQPVHRNDFPLTDWAWLAGWLADCFRFWLFEFVDTAHKWINLLLLLLNARVKICWFCLHAKIRPFATTDRSKLTDGARQHKCFIAWDDEENMYTHVLTINLVNFSARYIFRFAFFHISFSLSDCLFVFCFFSSSSSALSSCMFGFRFVLCGRRALHEYRYKCLYIACILNGNPKHKHIKNSKTEAFVTHM